MNKPKNFGDLYADHEAEQCDDGSIFVSHYNNQYDAIFGLLNQYLLSQENQWLELANDLARHVKDIDIYHTDEDREEYNQGYFWHTDHYLQAETCTHRTFSSAHQAVYEGYTSGGGPGPQHCYTTGLMLHYYLTGEESSKNTVLSLTQWIENNFEGANGLLSKLLAIKKSYNVGVKNHIDNLYPFDRGTGHYVVAQLDSFELSQDERYLSKAIEIIRNTIHPLDKIEDRNLCNIELTWFYTVFLQAVGRFLITKEMLKQFDDDYYYARDAILHYAEWMIDNEKPYLQQLDKLEFPTTTWLAQELRKIHIFRVANYFSPTDGDKYRYKAESFLKYVEEELSLAKNVDSTRVLVLLMQNLNGCYFGINEKVKNVPFKKIKYKNRMKVNKYFQVTKLLLKEIMHLSPIKELRWLCLRSEKFSNIFGKYLYEKN